MEFQYLISGITPGHGPQNVHSVNVPVSVAGMDVSPGELIHMDENGACKFPANYLSKVVENSRALRQEEENRIGKLLKAETLKEVKSILSGHNYVQKKNE